MKTIIIVIVIIGLFSIIGTIVIGTKTFDGLVVDKPYDKGLVWDAAQKDKGRMQATLVTKEFIVGENELIISVKDAEGKSLDDALVSSIVVSRPATEVHDKRFPVHKSEDGNFKGTVLFPLLGYWDVKMLIQHNGKDITIEERVYVEQKR